MATDEFGEIPERCTPEMIADIELGACERNRPGCIELGAWKPFYKAYVCRACIHSDRADLDAGRWPFGAP
jgi:hypothetical protein